MNILVLAPHADDEVLGCGGMIARRASMGHSVHVVVANMLHREIEMDRAAKILGVADITVLREVISKRDMVTGLDYILNGTYFDEVYFPSPSHHQDHQDMYHASCAALRIGTNKSPRLCATYEYPYAGNGFSYGKMYVDITDHLNAKVEAFLAYKSQVRAFPHPGSPTAIRALAIMRGVECGYSAAEAFHIHRIVR